MSRKIHVPKYRSDSQGRAFVEHRSIASKSRRMYLGRHGTEESLKRYQKFLARLSNSTCAVPCDRRGLTEVEILIDAYLSKAERHYARPWGRPIYDTNGKRRLDKYGKPILVSSEYSSMALALRPLALMYGDMLAIDFGPRCLTDIQSRLIELEYTRGGINDTISRIKRFFRWCCKQELCQPALYSELLCVGGLYIGQEGVIESEDVSPAPMASIVAVLPFLPPVVAAMIRVQYLCGMRPGETCAMRSCDIDRSKSIWIYYPPRHKTAWRGFSLFKAVPKSAQPIIESVENCNPQSYVFRPVDSAAWANDQRIKNRQPRKTTLYANEAMRVAKEKQLAKRRVKKREPQELYSTNSYRKAIERGFLKAAKAGVTIEYFSPNQLRHAIISDVSRILGQQQAQRYGGHENLKTTEIYTGLQLAELIEITGRLESNADFLSIAERIVAQNRP